MRCNSLNIVLFILLTGSGFGQDSLWVGGQLSGFAGYAPEDPLEGIAGGRYLPEMNYALKFQNNHQLDLDIGANLYGNAQVHPFDTSHSNGGINLYRLWARYTGKQIEVRAGLQKINFGSATLLRPLQWFDDIDPTDPLQFSNGVYGILGRVYFLNNANIWLWILAGNKNPRGFELIPNNPDIPEFGGRLQLPVQKGEVAVTYHHRTADSREAPGIPACEKIPENKYAVDAKWDIGIGLWFEASWIQKSRNIGALTNQSMLTAGADYTLGIGNGLNIGAEHLFISTDSTAFAFDNNLHVSAFMLTYPLGLFDRISGYLFYLWQNDGTLSFMINYQHSFSRFSLFVMPYYTPKMEQNLFTHRYNQSLTGPGIRIMAVFNH